MPTCDDLATKAELQELRDQLNAVLGEKEGGGTEEVFAIGAPPEVAAIAAGGTLFGLTKTRAAKALTDIVIQGGSSLKAIWRNLADGTAEITRLRADGSVSPSTGLKQVGKQIGQNTAATVAASQSAAAVSNSVALLSNLVSVAATLGISIATVKVLDKRIEAEARANQSSLDALNQGALKLHEKQQGDIDAVIADITETEAKIAQTEQNLTAMQLQLQEVAGGSVDLNTRLSSIENDANNVKNQVSEVKSQIAEFESEVEDLAANLQADIAQTEIAIDKALEAVETQKINNQLLENQLELIDQQVLDLQARQTLDRFQATKLKAEFEDLRLDLEEELEVADARTTALESDLIVMRDRAQKLKSGGGIPSSLVDGTVGTQNGLLDFMSKLLGVDAPPQNLTQNDLFNTYENSFQNQFDQLLDRVNPGTIGGNETVNQGQLDDLRTNLGADFDALLTTTIATTIIPQLNNLTIEKQIPQVSSAVQQGICQSLNSPSACPATPTNPNPINGLQGMNNNLLTALGIADLAQGMNITRIVSDTNAAVRHVDYGLEKAQNFAAKAWKMTRIQKLLDVLNLALSLHNAAMLSRNLAGSLGDILSGIINNTINLIKNEDESNININDIIGNTVENFLKGILGEATYTGISETFNKYSRIINAAANIIYSIQSVMAGLAEGLETMGRYTGKIGNALKKSGAVLENSYTWMSETFSVKTGRLGTIQKVLDGGEAIENVASEIEGATAEFREAQENVNQIGEQFDKVKDEVTNNEDDKNETETANKTNSQGAQPSQSELVPDPVE